jgi:hypothetical protein
MVVFTFQKYAVRYAAGDEAAPVLSEEHAKEDTRKASGIARNSQMSRPISKHIHLLRRSGSGSDAERGHDYCVQSECEAYAGGWRLIPGV